MSRKGERTAQKFADSIIDTVRESLLVPEKDASECPQTAGQALGKMKRSCLAMQDVSD